MQYEPLVLEVSGQKEGTGDIGDAKAAKVSTARDLWVPAVNGTGEHGRWAFLETDDPWDIQNAIRRALPELTRQAAIAGLAQAQ